MAAAPLMLALGVGQGVMGYMQGMENAKAAEANADNARKMQEYERQVRDNNVAIVQAASKREQEQQDLKNSMQLGRATAAMGASGVQITGTFMDVLGQEVMLGANKVAMIRGQGLRQEYGARNAGDLAIYRQDQAEYQYSQQAKSAKQGAMFSLAMGVLGGASGFAKQGGNWSDLFGGMFGGGSGAGGGSTALTGFNIGSGGVSQGSWSLFGGFNPNMSVKPFWVG